MLCQACLTTIKTAYERLNVYVPWAISRQTLHTPEDPLFNLYLSILKGYWVCRELWASMLYYGNYTTEYKSDFSEQGNSYAQLENRFATEFKFLEKSRKSRDWPIQFYMTSRDGVFLNLEVGKTLTLILKPTSTNEVLLDTSTGLDIASGSSPATGNPGLWRHWLRTCSRTHEKCHGADHKLQLFVPDRLVEIISDDDGNSFTWRLVCRADIGNVQYLTLSHCWGSSRHTSLKKENYSDFTRINKSSGLPKSFQDAFYITFSLGFHFIWIDSLCIIQDDQTDWEAQASMMRLVYQNACCNIAATWAADGDDGCFKMGESRIITLDLGSGQSIEYQLFPRLLYYDDNTEAPLNRRGWVAQERYLARRQLSFAKSQVYWECRELIASEQFPAGIPEFLRNFGPYNQAVPPNGKPTLAYTTEKDRRRAWAALVDFYSNCEFSVLSDKMIALTGLADDMRHGMGDIYLAGLWKKDLHRQLCWSTDIDVRERVNRSRTPNYLAPTWSWASVNGPVMSDQAYYLAHIQVSSCIHILEASVLSRHSSGLHSFAASRLVLRGIAFWARAVRLGNSDGHVSDSWELQFTDLKKDFRNSMSMNVSIHWDENMSGSEKNPERWLSFLEERNSTLLCMFVYIDLEDLASRGLLLRRIPSATNEATYVRMGIFEDFKGSICKLLSPSTNYPMECSVVEDIDLDDAGLADLVHTVTVV